MCLFLQSADLPAICQMDRMGINHIMLCPILAVQKIDDSCIITAENTQCQNAVLVFGAV